SFPACWMRGACTCPYSCGGVSQVTRTCGPPGRAEISRAAASAPVRAARNTGLFELLAITAIVIGPVACAESPPPPALPSPAGLSPPPHAVAASTASAAVARASRLVIITHPPLVRLCRIARPCVRARPRHPPPRNSPTIPRVGEFRPSPPGGGLALRLVLPGIRTSVPHRCHPEARTHCTCL